MAPTVRSADPVDRTSHRQAGDGATAPRDPRSASPDAHGQGRRAIRLGAVTLRTSAGIEAIRRLADLPVLHVGAGSVLVPDQVDAVVDAGARFVVSPGLSRDVVARCRARDVPALPGPATASELMAAVDL